MNINLMEGDCLEKIKSIPNESIDAIITDPPYGLSFMGKKWDYEVPNVNIWKETLRVLKPGGYLLSFAGTRTQHRMAVTIEDAGFEIRDMIAWVYGSGFPKSLNIGKAVDKLQGNKREVIGESKYNARRPNPPQSKLYKQGGHQEIVTKGTSEWEGWGTALKPALEPITVARKPLSEKTVALNVLKWGTGGIDIDGSRVEGIPVSVPMAEWTKSGTTGASEKRSGIMSEPNTLGRFPANLIHDGSDEVIELFPNTKSAARSSKHQIGNKEGKMFNHGIYGTYKAKNYDDVPMSEGSASRFFYCAKASKAERNRGCEGLDKMCGYEITGREKGSAGGAGRRGDKTNNGNWAGTTETPRANHHPTVKPIALMEYLIRLVSREDATILDPFMGSGTTGVACKNLGRTFIGIELDPDYFKICQTRINNTPDKLFYD